MEEKLGGKLLAAGLAAVVLLAQASGSWASNILAENTIDTIFLSSGTQGNISYTGIQTNWLGSVSVAGTVVASDGSTSNGLSTGAPNLAASTPTGLGTLANPQLDGTIQPNVMYLTNTNFGLVQPAVTVAPAGPDPLSSDFNIVASVIAATTDLNEVTAAARGSYLQAFMLTAPDLVTLNFNDYYNFQVNGLDRASAMTRYGYSIDNSPFIFTPWFSQTLDGLDPVAQNLVAPTLESISLGNLAAGPHTFELAADVSGTASVPEPGTYLLFGTGLLALVGFRCRQRRIASR